MSSFSSIDSFYSMLNAEKDNDPSLDETVNITDNDYFNQSMNKIDEINKSIDTDIDSMKVKTLNKQEQLALLKNITKNIVNINHIYSESENTIKKYNKKFGVSLYVSHNILCLTDFLKKMTTENDAKNVLHELMQEDPKLIRSYFNTLLYSWVKPDKDTLQIALNILVNNYPIVEELLFKQYGNLALTTIENNNIQYARGRKQYTLKMCNINETCFKYWMSHLDIIWNKYGNDLFQRAKRGPKLMLTLYFLYQEKFTDEMFNTLCERLKRYKNMFFVDYLLKCSRKLSEDREDKIASLKLMLNIM